MNTVYLKVIIEKIIVYVGFMYICIKLTSEVMLNTAYRNQELLVFMTWSDVFLKSKNLVEKDAFNFKIWLKSVLFCFLNSLAFSL